MGVDVPNVVPSGDTFNATADVDIPSAIVQVDMPNSNQPIGLHGGSPTPSRTSTLVLSDFSGTGTQVLSSRSDKKSSSTRNISRIRTPPMDFDHSSSSALAPMRDVMIASGRTLIRNFLNDILTSGSLPAVEVFGDCVKAISKALCSLGLSTEGWIAFAKGIEDQLAEIHTRAETLNRDALWMRRVSDLEAARKSESILFEDYKNSSTLSETLRAQCNSLSIECDRRGKELNVEMIRLQRELKQNQKLAARVETLTSECKRWTEEREKLGSLYESYVQKTKKVEEALERIDADIEQIRVDIEGLKQELCKNFDGIDSLSL